MNELSRKEDVGNTFSKLQNEYYRDVIGKFNSFTNNLDGMLNDGITQINGVMMSLGVGLA